MTSIVDRRDSFISDMMAMITSGPSNDVKIVLIDGEIVANKDVLLARSDYFATMFSNTKFIEGETKHVSFNHCSKAIMEKIIQYLFSGNMKLHDLSISDLVTMMNVTTMMLLDDLKGDIQKYILEIIPESGDNYGTLPELVESLMLAEQFKLDTIKKALVLELYFSLGNIPHIPEVVENSEAFKNLPFNLLEEFFLVFDGGEEDIEEDWIWKRIPYMKDRFDAFVFWLSENDCSSEEKERILETFSICKFTVKELLTDVKNSGLYPIEEIHDAVLEIYRSDEKEKEELRSWESATRKSFKEKKAKIKELEKENARLNEENDRLKALAS